MPHEDRELSVWFWIALVAAVSVITWSGWIASAVVMWGRP